jgi:hypothetical protein
MEGMLAPRPGARTAAIDQLLMRGERVPALGFAVYTVCDSGMLALQPMVFAPVGLIAIRLGLLPVQQFVEAGDVGFVGRSRAQAMHHTLRRGEPCAAPRITLS